VIPFVDLKAQYTGIKEEIRAAIDRVLESSQFALGEEVAAFEREFAAYCATPHAVGTNSGTSALHLALLAAGVGPGDEVITVPFTFIATAAAISYTGARPVFVDIEPRSFAMDPSLLEAAISPRTKVVIPVHLYGQPADMDPIMEIARRHGVAVIEDAAQAHDAEYKGRRAGSMGDLACFSFYPGKNLGAYGEGGVVVTSNPEYDRVIRMLRDWGQARRYHHEVLGYNYRMEGIQGAVLRVKLRHLPAWTEARRQRATWYDALLVHDGVEPPSAMPYARHVYHLYAIRVDERDRVQRTLADSGIQTGIHYPIPLHLQRAYAHLGHRLGDFPIAEAAAAEVLSLPMYPELPEESCREVARALEKATHAVARR
jgi:dTDP-4-amino-4,6-dideoxygalactose transaminase